MKPEITAILRQARSLVTRGFTPSHYAINGSKTPVGSCSSDAVAWCIAGAIDNVVQHNEVMFNDVWMEVLRAAKGNSAETIKWFGGFTQPRAINFFSTMLRESKSIEPNMTNTDIANLLA